MLAVILDEPGKEVVMAGLAMSQISAVNLSEVYTKLIEFGAKPSDLKHSVSQYGLRVRKFREEHALFGAKLRPLTKTLGLSLGDRACLTQGHFSSLPILTADQDWAKLDLDPDLGIDIRLIR